MNWLFCLVSTFAVRHLKKLERSECWRWLFVSLNFDSLEILSVIAEADIGIYFGGGISDFDVYPRDLSSFA